MELVDFIVLIGLLAAISIYGLYTAMRRPKKSSANEILHGSNVSVMSSALSVCSGFISAISLLGFPAEIYRNGTMFYWYGPMYAIAFPIVAFLFMPVFYNLKLTSIYEYLEIRFNFACRFLASLTFCVQTLLYISVALYAPALALSSITAVPLLISIIITAGLAAVYVILGGAKASIHTSALQMALILLSMIVIFSVSLYSSGVKGVISTAIAGGRLQFFDFRIDPRIRHSVWSLLIGGTGNILCLFATNQLTMQRYMAMGSLKSAKWVVLLNIPFNFLILTTYVGVGLIMYNVYFHCDPVLQSPDRLFPHFVVEQLSNIPGMIGLFTAAIYSAGLSTLSASYSALSAVFIEDVIKQFRSKIQRREQLKAVTMILLARTLPLAFCGISVALAYICSLLDTMILQISLSIFGVAGGPVLSVFVLGMFFPHIHGIAAFTGQMASSVFCFFVSGGALINHVRAVSLPLDRTCDGRNHTFHYEHSDIYGAVYPLNSDSWIVQLFRISYQYYSIVALIVSIIVSHVIQLIIGIEKKHVVKTQLLAPLLQSTVGNVEKEMELTDTKSSK